jgi:hypothetical protein
VSSAPIACANVLVSLFLSAPMALGTAHIHLLDTQLFSDYSPPIGGALLAVPLPQEEAFGRADSENKRDLTQGKTESVTLTVNL